MTQTMTTPTGDSNQPAAPTEPIDNNGNPINDDGSPREPAPKGDDNTGEDLESLKKALKDTKAELTKLQQGKNKDGEKEDVSEGQGEKDQDLQIKQQTQEAEKAGVDMAKYSDEFAETGQLSEDSYKELESKGFDKGIVDAYIEGQKAIAARQTAEVAQVVGGEENFNAIKEWAAESLSESEIAAFNTAVTSGTEAAKLAVQGLNARYVAENGSAPNLIGGETGNTGGGMFKSNYDMQQAMADPRYWKDPDYQKEVAEKAKRSMKAGKI